MNKVIKYSIEMAMLKKLFKNDLISVSEYKKIEGKIKKDFGVVSNITA